MIRSLLFDPRADKVTPGGQELIDVWRADPALLLWLDLNSEEPERDQEILEALSIHPLAVQDAMRDRHPPKIEQFSDYLFILLKGLHAQTEGIDFNNIQLSLFIGERILISRHNKESQSANWLYEQVQSGQYKGTLTPGGLAVSLSGRLLRRYIQILLDLEPRLDDIEEEMFEHPSDTLLAELTGYKSRLRHLARIANYHKHIVGQLRREPSPHIEASLKHEVIDLYEQVERSGSLADLYYEVARDLTDSYLAMSSHRLNNVMQMLTVITVIFVPLTFLAGIYGMNFQNMPELSTSFGYFAVLGIMAVVALLQFLYFKRRGWV